ncbi:MAG: hypothetical protein H0X03_03380 [Nitrosopumilus sp.]|nr:hypothetical protein [Nitrosopumilus sp.]
MVYPPQIFPDGIFVPGFTTEPTANIDHSPISNRSVRIDPKPTKTLSLIEHP